MQQQNSVRGASPEQLRQMLERLNQAMDNMRGAASSQQAGTPQGEAQARRAAEQLKEAEQMLSGLRSKETSNQVEDLARELELPHLVRVVL